MENPRQRFFFCKCQQLVNYRYLIADFEHEVKCLRKWLREMESRLQPLSFRVNWSRAELEEKAVEHMVSNWRLLMLITVYCIPSVFHNVLR